jgi:hypothetical protein
MRNPKSVCRYLCSELVFITRPDRRRKPAMLANLEEIGEWFAEVLTDCAFPHNAPLRIVSKDHQLEGVVEKCVARQPLGYFVKVKLSPQSRWSERWFTPQHLLQLWSGAPPKASTLEKSSGPEKIVRALSAAG